MKQILNNFKVIIVITGIHEMMDKEADYRYAI